MKIVIIEDEIPAQERLERLLKEIDQDIEVVSKIESVKEGVDYFAKNEAPDLLLMDIQLADGLSFNIFKSISLESPIIFCTAYDEYAIQAFKHNSIDYLLKPIDPKELEAAVGKYKRLFKEARQPIDLKMVASLLNTEKSTYKSRFMVKLGDKIQSISISNIAYFYSEQKATLIVTKDKRKHFVDYTLDQIQEIVDPQRFFRINRKYVSSYEAIEDIYAYSNSRLKVKLKSCVDEQILVSREKVGKLKEWLDQ